jgi:hypothetical protein
MMVTEIGDIGSSHRESSFAVFLPAYRTLKDLFPTILEWTDFLFNYVLCDDALDILDWLIKIIDILCFLRDTWIMLTFCFSYTLAFHHLIQEYFIFFTCWAALRDLIWFAHNQIAKFMLIMKFINEMSLKKITSKIRTQRNCYLSTIHPFYFKWAHHSQKLQI